MTPNNKYLSDIQQFIQSIFVLGYFSLYPLFSSSLFWYKVKLITFSFRKEIVLAFVDYNGKLKNVDAKKKKEATGDSKSIKNPEFI